MKDFAKGFILTIAAFSIIFVIAIVIYLLRRHRRHVNTRVTDRKHITKDKRLSITATSGTSIACTSLNFIGINNVDLDHFFHNFMIPYYDNTFYVFEKIMPTHCENIKYKLEHILQIYKESKRVDIKKLFIGIISETDIIYEIVMRNCNGILICYGLTLFVTNYKTHPIECNNELHIAMQNILREKLLEHVSKDKGEIDLKMGLVLKKFNYLFIVNLMNYIKKIVKSEIGRWIKQEFELLNIVLDQYTTELKDLIAQTYVNEIVQNVIKPDNDVFTAELISFQVKNEINKAEG